MPGVPGASAFVGSRFEGKPDRDDIVITTGTELGALLADGLGDGVLVECPEEDVDFLRTMSFGLLQVGKVLRDTGR
jgi:(E)-4-hydroxy-3-methylbut-2-enyl-diphosphate synthase